MEIKESDDSSVDYGSISKYIRKNSKKDSPYKKFETQKQGTVEVFGRVGEGEGNLENSNFHKRQEEENEGLTASSEKLKFTPKSNSGARQEFLKHLEDDSLTIDTCNRLNHDWKRE